MSKSTEKAVKQIKAIQPKKVKLRAFEIPNKELDKSKNDLLKHLNKRLVENKSKANDRMMILNLEDENKEEDLLSFYRITKSYICGSIIRIFYADETSKIPNDFLDHEQITMSELEKDSATTQNMRFKEHYYFFMNDSYLISNFQSNSHIKRFQTYINWLIQIERGDVIYEFTPKVQSVDKFHLSEIKNIEVKDSAIYKDDDSKIKSNSLLTLKDDLIKLFLNDVSDFDEIKKQQIVSAQLLLKFSKPKEMKKEAYEKIMGAYLKPISETDDVVFTTKKGKKINCSDILMTKDVLIELTESKMISEEQLLQEMELFIQEIKK